MEISISNVEIATPISRPVNNHPAIMRELWMLKRNSPMMPPMIPPKPARIPATKVWQNVKVRLLPFQMESSRLNPAPIRVPANMPLKAARKKPSEVMERPAAQPK